MKADSGGSLYRPPSAQEKGIEAGVQQQEQPQRGTRGAGATKCERAHQRNRCERAEPVSPAEVEPGRGSSGPEKQRHPGHSAAMEVRADHLPKRPTLEVGPLNLGIEPELRPGVGEPHAELDVFDARLGVATRIEAAGPAECVEPNRPEAGPEGRGPTWRALVDEVVQQVPEARDGSRRLGRVVVRAEERHEVGVTFERRADPPERVSVRQDVCVHEHEDVSFGLCSAFVAGGGGTRSRGVVHHDHLLRWIVGCPDRGQNAPKLGRRVDRKSVV